MTFYEGLKVGFGAMCGVVLFVQCVAGLFYFGCKIYDWVMGYIYVFKAYRRQKALSKKIQFIQSKYDAEALKGIDFSKLDMFRLNVLEESLALSEQEPCRGGRGYE